MEEYLGTKIIILIYYKKINKKFQGQLIIKIRVLLLDLNQGRWTKNKDKHIAMRSNQKAINKIFQGLEHILKGHKQQTTHQRICKTLTKKITI